jgi:TPR repeat protein
MACQILAGCARGSVESRGQNRGAPPAPVAPRDAPPRERVQVWERDCSAGVAGACFNLGILYDFADGVARDLGKAFAMYKKACDGGDTLGCTSLAMLYANGEGVARDPALAVSLYERACEQNGLQACSNLGIMYEMGHGVPKDAARSVALFSKACTGDFAEACTKLGVMYENGAGVTKSMAMAKDLYKRGCDGRDPIGCRYYAGGGGLGEDRLKFVDQLKKECAEGNEKSCTKLRSGNPFDD